MGIWISVYFDNQEMDNVVANNQQEADEIIKSIETLGFANYNEDVKEDWLSMGFRNNPIVSAKISD